MSGTTLGSTLVEELEQAAKLVAGEPCVITDGLLAIAARLRARAERVRRLELALSARFHNTLTFDFVRSIIGPAATQPEPGK